MEKYLLLIWLFFFVIFCFIFIIRPLYCFIFEHKEWVQWKYWLSCFNEFKYQYSNCGNKKFVNRFDENIVAWIWADGYCSIHNEQNESSVLVGAFDKTHSKRMAELLSYLIKEEISLKDWIIEQNM